MKLGINWSFWKSKVFWTNFIILIIGAAIPSVRDFVQNHPQEVIYFWSALNIVLRLVTHGKVELED